MRLLLPVFLKPKALPASRGKKDSAELSKWLAASIRGAVAEYTARRLAPVDWAYGRRSEI
ncbi:protein of unknown function [Hyphomicrobium sp. MC1]|nr:protein of unknown function [Hyphomicrobium sp. MC1]